MIVQCSDEESISLKWNYTKSSIPIPTEFGIEGCTSGFQRRKNPIKPKNQIIILFIIIIVIITQLRIIWNVIRMFSDVI